MQNTFSLSGNERMCIYHLGNRYTIKGYLFLKILSVALCKKVNNKNFLGLRISILNFLPKMSRFPRFSATMNIFGNLACVKHLANPTYASSCIKCVTNCNTEISLQIKAVYMILGGFDLPYFEMSSLMSAKLPNFINILFL